MNQFTVLAVDDSPQNLVLLKNFLSLKKIPVILAENGSKAMAILEEDPLPDLILLDVMMPGIDGFEVCRRLKENERTADIPIIFLTALSDTNFKVRGFQAGGMDYVTKPFQFEELLARVETQLNIQALKKDLKRKNQELESSNAELTDAIEAKKEVLRIAAHDLKNPLNSVLGFLELLRARYDDQGGKELIHIERGAYMMLDIIDHLLRAEEMGDGEIESNPQTIPLEGFLSDELENFSTGLYSGIHKINLESGADCLVDFDYLHLREIMQNYLSNAVKFSPANTTVTVSTHLEGDNVVISVSDQGPGLTDDDLQKVFGKFQRLSAKALHGSTSTGLGLSIVKTLSELNQASVGVANNHESGCTFYLKMKMRSRMTS